MANENDWAAGVDLPSAGDGFDTPTYSFDDELDVGSADASRIGSGNIKVNKPGFYHFSIKATAKPEPYENGDMTKERKPSILCTCTVQVPANGQPDGAIHYHDIVLGGKGGGALQDSDRDKTLNFLVGLGVLKNQGDKVIDPETGTTKIRTATLVDRINKVGHFIGNLHLSPANTGKDGRQYEERIEFNYGRGAFPVTAKEVRHVPKNLDALKAAGIEVPAAGAAKPNV